MGRDRRHRADLSAAVVNRPTRAAAAAASLGIALLALGVGPVSAQQSWASFSTVAEADGLRVTAVVPGGPVTDRVLDGGAPRAQARLDSLGTSTAFAAAPWPGELVANATGLLSGPTGLPLPTYPFLATSSHPTAAQDSRSVGPFLLSAGSEERSSTARARMGQQAAVLAGELDASAAVTRTDDQTLTAQAQSSARQLVVGPLVLGRVEAHATVSRSLGGKLVRTSSLDVTGARVGDQAVELTPAGIVLAGTTVPVAPDHPALTPLVEQGITVRWAGAVDTPDGVRSPAVEITVTRPVSLTGQGASTTTYTLGHAVAVVSASAAGTGASTSPAPEPESKPPSAAPPATELDAGLTPLPPLPVRATAPMPPPPLAAAQVPPEIRTVTAGRRAVELWPSFYVPLVVAGALGVGAVLSLRTWGVKRVWAS